MSVQQNNCFITFDGQKRKFCSLPPKVMGNVCGFLTLKLGRIVWSMNTFKNVAITVGWWGESNPLILRPCIKDGNKFAKIDNEIIYEIRTDPETFEQYLRDCESLEFNVINEEVNESIGKISVSNLTSIISERSYGGCFSVIDEKGFTTGDIYITFDLFLLQKKSLNEISFHKKNEKVGMNPYSQKEQFCKSMSAILKNKKKDQISNLQTAEDFNLANSKSLFTLLSCDIAAANSDVKADKPFKQITSNNGSIEKADPELSNGIQKEFCVGMKEATSPDFIGGAVHHLEAVKQANSMRINILSLSLNRTVVHQENTNFKHFRSNYNTLCQHIVSSSFPSKAAYFVEYEIPVLNITANKSDISRNSCPWNKRIIRFCSRRQMGSEIYFGQSSVHHLPRRKGCWLENFKDLKIVIKVFLRNSNQRVPLQIGKAALEMCSVMNSESLSFSSESPVFSLAQVPHPFCIGKLRTNIELGRDCKYFGKEFFNVTVNEGRDSLKGERAKKNKIQENSKEMFNGLHMSEKEQQENKENLPETEVKEQCAEKPLLLYGLIYISSARGFNVRNSYVISKSFWKEDFAVSNICWETSSPNYNLRELVPVLLSAEFLERCRKNFLVVEAWERKPVAQNDTLIGIAKLSLNQFFVAFRNPLLMEQLIRAKYPLVGEDGWVNVFNPMTRLQAGQLHAVLCLGTEDQIQLFERVHGIMETSCVQAAIQPFNSMHYGVSSFAIKPENYQFNSGPKQVILPSKSADETNTDDSRSEVPFNVHHQNKINQENIIPYKNYNQNLTNPPEALLTKQSGISCETNMNAKPHRLQQDVDENKSSQNYGAYIISQSVHQENSAEQILETTSGISVAENVMPKKLDTDKEQSYLGVTKILGNNVSPKQTCTVKNKECQTDLFVLDLQHYSPDFLAEHDKHIEPLIIKLSRRGLEIIKMNEDNANTKILDTESYNSNCMKDAAEEMQNQQRLPKDVTCFKQHDPVDNSSAGDTTYAFSFSGDKEHDMLNSGDDTNTHDSGGDSDGKFSAKKNKDEADKDHKMKSVGDIERGSKTSVCNSNQNSMKLQQTSAANETETNQQVAKDHNCFKNMKSPTKVSDNAHFPSYAHITPEYSVVSANYNFCARIEVNEGLNLSLQGPDEAERNVYVSFHLNNGCAKVIIDGEVQLKTGLLFTPAVACNGNPVWNWHCEAWLPSDLLTDTSKQLIMKIWQKSNKRDAVDHVEDILLGLASIDLKVVLLGMPQVCDWFNIVNFTGSCVGQIKVSVKPQENLDRFRTGRINLLPDSNANNSLIEANSSLKGREHHTVQKINCHHPDTNLCFVKHTKALSQTSSLTDTKALKHEKIIPLEWDLDFPDDATSLLTKALRQKLSELDEITKRLKRRLLSVTSERVSPASLVSDQEEVGMCCKKSDQKQKSSASIKNCTHISSDIKVNSPKAISYNAICTLAHRNCCCTQSSTISHSENAREVKHLNHSSNKMDSKLSKCLGTETSYEQLQCNCEKVSENQFENSCQQCKESNADLEIGEKDLENNDTEKGANKDNDVEDFDALTDVLMETATKELDIANVFNPLLFQQLLLSNANLIQSKCQRDKCSKRENVYNLSDSQNSSEIMFKFDETLLTVCSMKKGDNEAQGVSCSLENNNMQCSEKICHSDVNSFHKVIEMDKFKKLGNHMENRSEKQQSCQEKFIINKRVSNDSADSSEPLAPLIDANKVAKSSLNVVQTLSNLEKQCKPQQCHQLVMPIHEESFHHKVPVSSGNKVPERLPEQKLSENIESHKEIESCSEFSSLTRKQKLSQSNVKESFEVLNTQAKNGYDNKEHPPDVQGKQKQRSVVCRLAPLFLQKLGTKHE